MRFGDLEGLTSLPVGRLRERFRYEEIVTVLPARVEGTGHDAILVATRPMLAILTAIPEGSPPGEPWMTSWAPWDSVRFLHDAEPGWDADDEYRLTVLVGGLTFHARLAGESGRRALRDFVVAVQAVRAALAATW